jgi:hypothetical protein
MSDDYLEAMDIPKVVQVVLPCDLNWVIHEYKHQLLDEVFIDLLVEENKRKQLLTIQDSRVELIYLELSHRCLISEIKQKANYENFGGVMGISVLNGVTVCILGFI